MLRTTHRSSVTEDQIDHLGHMNVRYYAANAHAGTKALLDELGWGDQTYEIRDSYTRHHHEQMLGTPLVVRSAVLGADARSLRIHHELAAEDSGVLGATFVHCVTPIGPDGTPIDVAPGVVERASAAIAPVPDYAATRSISLDVDRLIGPVTLDAVRDRGLALRRPRSIEAEECDAEGRYRIEMAAMLTWGGEFIDPDDVSEIFFEDDEGVRMGWANMESRVQIGRLPKVGDRIQSFGATASVQDKVTHRIHWVFDLDDGELISAFEVVSLAFDVEGRRSRSIPDHIRTRQLAELHEDLIHRSPAEAGA